jgi:hypothetical protein
MQSIQCALDRQVALFYSFKKQEIEMTTLQVNVRDDKKVNDVVSFLRDIDFLEVIVKEGGPQQTSRRRPAQDLLKTRILGDIMESVIPDSDWEVLHEASS